MAHLTKVTSLAASILQQMPEVGRWQTKFLLHLFVLWLSIRGRHNFVHLARYGKYGESTYRKNFGRTFDFLSFNIELSERHLGPVKMLAFDPSYLPKSGGCTEGVYKFWSGVASMVKPGLEIGGLAVIDEETGTALHLLATQTIIDPDDGLTLLDRYAQSIIKHKTQLLGVSKYLAVDAYFAKKPFIDQLTQAGFSVITRLRKDVRLRYLYEGPHPQRRGPKKKYDGRVDLRQLDMRHFKPCDKAEDGSWAAFEAVVNVQSWKRSARVVIVHHYDDQGEISRAYIYCSTDVESSGQRIFRQYPARYQQEFLFRDAKQELGLTHCQAYTKEKIHFHVNTALTVGSLAKAAHHLSDENEAKQPFSIADVKTLYVNEFQGLRIITMFRKHLNTKLIEKAWEEIRSLGLRRA